MMAADKQLDYARADEQPGIFSNQDDEDDAEGHMRALDKALVQGDDGDAQAPGSTRF